MAIQVPTQVDMHLLEQLTTEIRRWNDERIPDVLVSSKEAARFLGCTPQTICANVKQGKLTRRTKGGVTGIPLAELMNAKKTRREAGELPRNL